MRHPSSNDARSSLFSLRCFGLANTHALISMGPTPKPAPRWRTLSMAQLKTLSSRARGPCDPSLSLSLSKPL